ncbi:MAG: NAD-dependent deacylase [Gammaproteobacteria bacterium]|nr:NAD-dependent deacylase [Gammaproteobacteria bacterium]MCP5458011.1 NAD-dependent deacylase [Gammaproteobacteria bacterium]
MITLPEAFTQALRAAQRVAVLTGAGISAESGVPTFREAQTGLWAQYDPQQLATPEAFQANPKLVWDWYAWRRKLVRAVEPNLGHHALVSLEQRLPHLTLITQNVDGLHRRAGSRNILELHGDLFATRCFKENTPVEPVDDNSETPPRCARCGSWLRPGVVWFGESLPAAELHQAEAAAARCELFLSIGTSSLVYPAAELPFLALRSGATVVEINPQPTPLSQHAHFVLQGAAGEILPALLSQAFPDEPT